MVVEEQLYFPRLKLTVRDYYLCLCVTGVFFICTIQVSAMAKLFFASLSKCNSKQLGFLIILGVKTLCEQ